MQLCQFADDCQCMQLTNARNNHTVQNPASILLSDLPPQIVFTFAFSACHLKMCVPF